MGFSVQNKELCRRGLKSNLASGKSQVLSDKGRAGVCPLSNSCLSLTYVIEEINQGINKLARTENAGSVPCLIIRIMCDLRYIIDTWDIVDKCV